MAGSGTLVIDVGSSSLKAALVAADESPLTVAEQAYDPHPIAHRQEPDAWWRAACTAVRSLGPIHPERVTFSGTMENLIPVSDTGEAVGPAILYTDPCGERFCRDKQDILGEIEAASILGNEPEPLMSAFKILWLAKSDPEALLHARWLLLSPKDQLILRMTGRAVADPTTATTSGMMNLATRQWSAELLTALDIDSGRLPELLPADAVVGVLRAEPAADLGLRPGLPVVNGCGDAGATTLGSGCAAVGDASVYLGTSGWVARVVGDHAIAIPRPCYRLAHPMLGQVIEIVPILAAGACAAWGRRLFGLETAEADELAWSTDADPPELIFLPYLSGERSPQVNLDARGGFVGLDAGHAPSDLYYAILEGVGFAIAGNLLALCAGDRPETLSLSGGGARSSIWPQLIADIVGTWVRLLPDPEFAPAVGAARLTGYDGAETSRPGRVIPPRVDRAARRERLASVFASGTELARHSGLQPRQP